MSAALAHAVLAASVALAMVLAGLDKRALVRRSERRCPACGRDVRVCHCL